MAFHLGGRLTGGAIGLSPIDSHSAADVGGLGLRAGATPATRYPTDRHLCLSIQTVRLLLVLIIHSASPARPYLYFAGLT